MNGWANFPSATRDPLHYFIFSNGYIKLPPHKLSNKHLLVNVISTVFKKVLVTAMASGSSVRKKERIIYIACAFWVMDFKLFLSMFFFSFPFVSFYAFNCDCMRCCWIPPSYDIHWIGGVLIIVERECEDSFVFCNTISLKHY